MRKGKYQSKGTKIVVLMLAMMLVFGCAMGGTLAYLMTSSGPVTNTFTVGDINIELKEHKLDGSLTDVGESNYKVLPGTEQNKDPFVIVKAKSEACWLFVKVEEVNNNPELVSFDVDEAVWTPLDGVAGVYYKNMAATGDADSDPIYILENNKVRYSADLEKADLSGKAAPQLIFTAYAVQKEAGTAAEAWDLVD